MLLIPSSFYFNGTDAARYFMLVRWELRTNYWIFSFTSTSLKRSLTCSNNYCLFWQDRQRLKEDRDARWWSFLPLFQMRALMLKSSYCMLKFRADKFKLHFRNYQTAMWCMKLHTRKNQMPTKQHTFTDRIYTHIGNRDAQTPDQQTGKMSALGLSEEIRKKKESGLHHLSTHTNTETANI